MRQKKSILWRPRQRLMLFLSMDYQFTFNLSKVRDKYITAISFKNKPTKSDVDVDFAVKCVNKGGQSTNAKFNLTVRNNPAMLEPISDTDIIPVLPEFQQERVIFKEQNCTFFKHRFAKDEYNLGAEENTTFYVYVYDFETPLEIVVSFSLHTKLDLLQLFIASSASIGIVIGVLVGASAAIMIITLISCYCCSCCLLYKKRHPSKSKKDDVL